MQKPKLNFQFGSPWNLGCQLFTNYAQRKKIMTPEYRKLWDEYDAILNGLIIEIGVPLIIIGFVLIIVF